MLIFYGDYGFSYDEMLSYVKTPALMVKCLRQMLHETFKSIRKQNSNGPYDMGVFSERRRSSCFSYCKLTATVWRSGVRRSKLQVPDFKWVALTWRKSMAPR